LSGVTGKTGFTPRTVIEEQKENGNCESKTVSHKIEKDIIVEGNDGN
jgi:hypothetical protein